MLPPKSGLWPLFSSPPSIPSCLRLLQPEGILPQPASGRTCPSPLPFSSSGDGRSSDGRGRREACTQQGLWLGGGGALLLPSPCHHAPLTPPPPLPQHFPGLKSKAAPAPSAAWGLPGPCAPVHGMGQPFVFKSPHRFFLQQSSTPCQTPVRGNKKHTEFTGGGHCAAPQRAEGTKFQSQLGHENGVIPPHAPQEQFHAASTGPQLPGEKAEGQGRRQLAQCHMAHGLA